MKIDESGENPENNENKESKTNVVVLNESNWDSTLLENDKAALVLFYAPWCGHCKNVMPEYDMASIKLNTINSYCNLYKIDATENKNLSETFNITG